MTTTDAVNGTLGVVMAAVFGMNVFGALAAVPTGVLMVVNGAVLGGSWTEWWVFVPMLVFSWLGAVVGFLKWLNGDWDFS